MKQPNLAVNKLRNVEEFVRSAILQLETVGTPGIEAALKYITQASDEMKLAKKALS